MMLEASCPSFSKLPLFEVPRSSFLRHPGARFRGHLLFEAPRCSLLWSSAPRLRNFVASVVKKFSHDSIGSGEGALVVGGEGLDGATGRNQPAGAVHLKHRQTSKNFAGFCSVSKFI